MVQKEKEHMPNHTTNFEHVGFVVFFLRAVFRMGNVESANSVVRGDHPAATYEKERGDDIVSSKPTFRGSIITALIRKMS